MTAYCTPEVAGGLLTACQEWLEDCLLQARSGWRTAYCTPGVVGGMNTARKMEDYLLQFAKVQL